MLYSPAQPIKVSCAGLSNAWYGNIVLPQCATTDYESVAGLIVHSPFKNIVMEYSHIQKWRYEIKHRMEKKKQIKNEKINRRKKEKVLFSGKGV
jgi:hypothetical protein